MNRLTKKIGENYCSQNGDFYDLYNKLGKLEDLEEELGIDLITLFKMFKKEMVFKNKDGNETHVYPLDYDGVYSLIRNKKGWALKYGITNYYLKNFNDTFRFSTKTKIGKDWSLKRKRVNKDDRN